MSDQENPNDPSPDEEADKPDTGPIKPPTRTDDPPPPTEGEN